MKPVISLSIVSHGQAELVAQLLQDIDNFCDTSRIEVIVTINIPEKIPFSASKFPFVLQKIVNSSPKGFGANHNQAFDTAEGEYFCVLNPDIRLQRDPFPELLIALQDSKVALVAPNVIAVDGSQEDSARYFPTLAELIGKLFGKRSAVFHVGEDAIAYPDWVAGMFMLLPARIFREAEGFDLHYFLYYEDVDLCARLSLLGYRIAMVTAVSVVHDAQRTSHRNQRYLRWHLSSIFRFFSSPAYRKLSKRN